MELREDPMRVPDDAIELREERITIPEEAI
jgi:hypothetical protein